jgi:hypothetical protein
MGKPGGLGGGRVVVVSAAEMGESGMELCEREGKGRQVWIQVGTVCPGE